MKSKSIPVAIQGERGAFSEVAARQLIGPDVEVLGCSRFDDVFQALKAERAAVAVIPIENTLHGSVHENYDHLVNFELPIVAEMRVVSRDRHGHSRSRQGCTPAFVLCAQREEVRGWQI